MTLSQKDLKVYQILRTRRITNTQVFCQGNTGGRSLAVVYQQHP